MTLVMVVGAVWVGMSLIAPGPEERDSLALAIDEIVESEMEEGRISGVSIAVARGLRVLYTQGYGYADLENELPATAETVYRVGSITKQFTASAIMQLVEEGDLGLDDGVTTYLPDYAKFKGVTIEHLLSHTSGVRNYTTIAEWWGQLGLERSPQRLSDFFRDAPLDFEPGSRFAYSNSGYVLLGMIMEEVTGRPYGGILNEKIFVPAALESTAYCDDRILVANRARGYQVVDGEHQNAPYVSISQAYSAGGVCSTVLDLLRWSRELVRGAVVDDRSYERMSSPGTLNDGSRIEYGFGLAVSYLEGRHRVTHIGGMLGYTGQISHYDEDGVTVVVLTNTEEANAAKIESDIARLVLGLDDQAIRDVPLSDDELAAYTGRYDLGLTQVDVVAEDGRLVVDVILPGIEGRYVLLHQGDDAFLAEDDSEISVTFTVDAAGGAIRFVLVRRGITTEAERVA